MVDTLQIETCFGFVGLGGFRFPARRIANLLILESTPTLLEVFLNGYAKNPQGYTAPELVSMWSSILNQEGVSVCSRYCWLGLDWTISHVCLSAPCRPHTPRTVRCIVLFCADMVVRMLCGACNTMPDAV